MGQLLDWSVYAAGRFNKCRAAAMGNYPPQDKTQ